MPYVSESEYQDKVLTLIKQDETVATLHAQLATQAAEIERLKEALKFALNSDHPHMRCYCAKCEDARAALLKGRP